jgi:hypothetical protein
MSLLDTKSKLLHLRMGNNTNNLAKLGDALQLLLNILAIVLRVLLGILGISLPLALVPVLVTTTLKLLTQMLGKDGGKSPQPTRGLEVADDSNNDHGRGLEDGNGIDDFAFVHDGSGTIDAADDVGHAGFIGAECGEVAGSGGVVVAGEGADAAVVVLGAFLGEKSQVAMARCLELSVGHG